MTGRSRRKRRSSMRGRRWSAEEREQLWRLRNQNKSLRWGEFRDQFYPSRSQFAVQKEFSNLKRTEEKKAMSNTNPTDMADRPYRPRKRLVDGPSPETSQRRKFLRVAEQSPAVDPSDTEGEDIDHNGRTLPRNTRAAARKASNSQERSASNGPTSGRQITILNYNPKGPGVGQASSSLYPIPDRHSIDVAAKSTDNAAITASDHEYNNDEFRSPKVPPTFMCPVSKPADEALSTSTKAAVEAFMESCGEYFFTQIGLFVDRTAKERAAEAVQDAQKAKDEAAVLSRNSKAELKARDEEIDRLKRVLQSKESAHQEECNNLKEQLGTQSATVETQGSKIEDLRECLKTAADFREKLESELSILKKDNENLQRAIEQQRLAASQKPPPPPGPCQDCNKKDLSMKVMSDIHVKMVENLQTTLGQLKAHVERSHSTVQELGELLSAKVWWKFAENLKAIEACKINMEEQLSALQSWSTAEWFERST